MEKIERLREICQASRAWSDSLHGRIFSRRISIYITYFFLKTGIRANAATGIFVSSGIFAGIIFAAGGKLSVLFGALILQLWYVLDHVDGEVARYNEETSLTGVYYDYVVHYIVHSVVFLALGWGFFKYTGDIFYLVMGVAGGMGVIFFSLIVDMKDLVIYRDHRISSSGEEVMKKLREKKSPDSLPFNLFSIVYGACTFPVIMDILTFSAIADIVFKWSVTSWIFVFYAIALNFMWIIRMSVFIVKRRVDNEVG